MRISYWSSDVCSSDLTGPERRGYQRGSGHSLVLPLRQLVWAEQTVLPAAGAECVDGFVHPIEAGQQWREPAPALSLGPRAEDRRATVQPVEHCRIDGIQPLPQVDHGLPLRAEVLPRSEEHTSELQSLMRIP